MRLLTRQLEALLFLAGRPVSIKRCAELTNAPREHVETALQELQDDYQKNERGLALVRSGGEYQMTTSPYVSALAQAFLKDETTGELTRPQLETLTIIAYRGPITKMQLEQIRGVNCGLILRNLLMRGLIQSETTKEKFLSVYTATIDFLRFLGVGRVEELPDYERLHKEETIDRLLEHTPS